MDGTLARTAIRVAAAPTVAPGAVLASVVAVTRSVFGAAASSVLLLDEAARELVFAAVAGEGAATLVGRRFPADRGIAGWVAATGEAMLVEQVSSSAMFAADVAESTGYVPESIMAAQISHDGACLGVLEVLDMSRQARGEFGDLDLLTLLAGHAAIAMRGDVGQAAGGRAEQIAVEGLIGQLRSGDPQALEAACQMLQALASFFGGVSK
jgi:hypothetical protein